jgi:tetratricopeptide (TPR) repeat protein
MTIFLSIGRPSPAAAGPEEASRQFDRATAAFDRGDYVTAGEAFESAYAADPQPAALWNAARSWHRAGEQARAANLYRRYLREAPADALDRDAATTSVTDLGARLGRLEIVAPGATELLVDERAATDTTWFVNPGSHLVRARFGALAATRDVSIDAGGTKTVVLEPPRAAAPAEPVRPKTAAPPSDAAGAGGRRDEPKQDESWRGTSPWVFAAFAGTTALAGAFTIASGIDTLIARSDYLDIPEDERTPNLYDEGKFKQDRTNVLIGVTSGLALVTAVVGIVAIDWGEGTLVGIAPAGAQVRVAF